MAYPFVDSTPQVTTHPQAHNAYVDVKAHFGATGDGATDDTTACQNALNAAAGGVCVFPSGTYLVTGLDIPVNASVQGGSLLNTVIKLKNGANTAYVMQSAGFAGLTGGSSTGGTFRTHIRDLTIDGNKANNASGGQGLRIYGKAFMLNNIAIQNAKTDGLYTEYGGADNFSTPANTLEARFTNLCIQQCGSSGWVHKGPHDAIISDVVIFSNGAWGWDLQTDCHAKALNTYLCASGGIWVHASGSIIGADIVGSTATGWGMLIDTGTGDTTISDGTWAGPIGLELKSPNHVISGTVANTTTAGVKLNGGAATMNLVMFNNSGYWFDVVGASGLSNVTVATDSTSGTLFNGTSAAANTWLVNGGDAAHSTVRLGSRTLNAGGYSPVLPLSNGTLVAGNTGLAYTVTNPTTDRGLNVTADTLPQVAEVLGTLIADLQSLGLIG